MSRVTVLQAIRDDKCAAMMCRCPIFHQRAAPLVGAKVKITVKNAVCPSLPFAAYGVFDCDFGFPSHEWSCSERTWTCVLEDWTVTCFCGTPVSAQSPCNTNVLDDPTLRWSPGSGTTVTPTILPVVGSTDTVVVPSSLQT